MEADRGYGSRSMNLVDEKYVSLSTSRRNGEAVDTPVWIAPMSGGRAGFTTAADSGKVKRIRNDPSVTVVPSDMRGKVSHGTATTSATAEVVIGGEAFEEVRVAMSKKYGIQFALVLLGGKFKKMIGRGEPANCAVVLTFDD